MALLFLLLMCLQWLDEAGSLRCSSTGLDSAAEGGHVHVLQVLCMCVSFKFAVTSFRCFRTHDVLR